MLRLTGCGGERWRATAWGRNLADEDYLQEVIVAPEFGGAFIHDSPGGSYGLDVPTRSDDPRGLERRVAIGRQAEEVEVDRVVVLAECGRRRADAVRASLKVSE